MAVQEVEPVDRADLIECLAHLVAYARKQQHITARLSTDEPTAWDRAHHKIDWVLDDLLNQ